MFAAWTTRFDSWFAQAGTLDLVPELLAGPLGFGDDAVVLVAAGVAIWRILRKRTGGTATPPPGPDMIPDAQD